MTDSRLTYKTGNLTTRFRDTGTKLFLLDGRTVCSFSDFAIDPGIDHGRFETETAGILAKVHDDLKDLASLDFRTKLEFTSHTIAHFLDLSASAYEATGSHASRERFHVRILMAGLDNDGDARIGSADISINNVNDPSRDPELSKRVSVPVESVGDSFIFMTGGIDSEVQARLTMPQSFPEEPRLASFTRAKRLGIDKNLSAEELTDLAEYLESKASELHQEIGGGIQEALVTAHGATITKMPTGLEAITEPRVRGLETDVTESCNWTPAIYIHSPGGGLNGDDTSGADQPDLHLVASPTRRRSNIQEFSKPLRSTL